MDHSFLLAFICLFLLANWGIVRRKRYGRWLGVVGLTILFFSSVVLLLSPYRTFGGVTNSRLYNRVAFLAHSSLIVGSEGKAVFQTTNGTGTTGSASTTNLRRLDLPVSLCPLCALWLNHLPHIFNAITRLDQRLFCR